MSSETRINVSLTYDQLAELDQYIENNGIVNRSAAIRHLLSNQKNLASIREETETMRRAINHMDRELQILIELISSIIGENGWSEFFPTDSDDAPELVKHARNYVGNRIHAQSMERYNKLKTGEISE